MNIIKGRSINQLVYKTLTELNINGSRTPSRNGGAVALYDTSLIFENPRARHLSLIGRKNNIYATFAEVFWVMAGEEKINPFLSFFLPRAHDYSDDGVTWRAAYGERIYSNGQLDNAISAFITDGLYTRRSVISILMPDRDTNESLQSKYGLENTKDIPCNNWINFFVTPDKKLNMKVVQRSGDIIWGTGNINLPEFSVLQEYVLQRIQEQVDPEVQLGYYNHSVTNLHLYDFTSSQASEILSRVQTLSHENRLPCIFPKENMKMFFQQVVNIWSTVITSFGKYSELQVNCDDLLDRVTRLFEMHKVPTKNNMLYDYATIITSYISNKSSQVDLVKLDSEDLVRVINNSAFAKNIKAELR